MKFLAGKDFCENFLSLNLWIDRVRIALCNIIDHFTVLCSVTRPLNNSEAGGYLALIQILLLLLCKSYCNAN